MNEGGIVCSRVSFLKSTASIIFKSLFYASIFGPIPMFAICLMHTIDFFGKSSNNYHFSGLTPTVSDLKDLVHILIIGKVFILDYSYIT